MKLLPFFALDMKSHSFILFFAYYFFKFNNKESKKQEINEKYGVGYVVASEEWKSFSCVKKLNSNERATENRKFLTTYTNNGTNNDGGDKGKKE